MVIMKLTRIPHYIFANVRRLYQQRCFWYFIRLLLLILLLRTIHYVYIFTVEQIFFQRNYIQFVQQFSNNTVHSSGCVLPKLDPWDERAKPYFFKVPPISCKNIQPYLTEVTITGVLQWNRSELNSIDVQELFCYYQEITRTEKNDWSITTSPRLVFDGSAQLFRPFVTIACSHKYVPIYYNIHSWIPPSIYAHLKPSNTPRPNVQIFILDAVSQSNFIRQLPKTYKVLTEEMSSVVMKGLITVGLNAYPNVVAMLTGSKMSPKNNGHDDLPLVWKNFSQAGYVTSLAEVSSPNDAAFNYKESGFINQPTDYYMRPFWLAVNLSRDKFSQRPSEHCFGNIVQHRLILDFIKQSLNVFQRYRYSFFSLTSLAELSHDELNLLQVLDDDLSQFFQRFHKMYSDNTILIVMSYHGINFGKFGLHTQLGHIESTIPYFSIFLPQKLKNLYPNLEMNLRVNQERMSSWFDVYDTLMDIVDLRFDKPRQRWSQHGNSLFYPLPENRTCEGTGIPLEFCPCEQEIQLSPHSIVDLANIAQDIVNYINDLLKSSPQCTPLAFHYIQNVVKIIPSPFVAKANGFQNVFRLIIAVKPNGALFEATMKSDAWSRIYEPVGIIIRKNKFDNTTNCVDDGLLKYYCCCNC